VKRFGKTLVAGNGTRKRREMEKENGLFRLRPALRKRMCNGITAVTESMPRKQP
jgi:hypothetical protein